MKLIIRSIKLPTLTARSEILVITAGATSWTVAALINVVGTATTDATTIANAINADTTVNKRVRAAAAGGVLTLIMPVESETDAVSFFEVTSPNHALMTSAAYGVAVYDESYTPPEGLVAKTDRTTMAVALVAAAITMGT